MQSLILRTASQFLLPLLALFSLYLLLRGHNEPGGGFAGGLMGAAAVALYAIAFDVSSSRRILRVEPHLLIGVGLALALLSAVMPLLVGDPLLTGKWTELHLTSYFELHLGTPLLFDVGVYLVVVGVTLLMIFSLMEE